MAFCFSISFPVQGEKSSRAADNQTASRYGQCINHQSMVHSPSKPFCSVLAHIWSISLPDSLKWCSSLPAAYVIVPTLITIICSDWIQSERNLKRSPVPLACTVSNDRAPREFEARLAPETKKDNCPTIDICSFISIFSLRLVFVSFFVSRFCFNSAAPPTLHFAIHIAGVCPINVPFH